MNYIEKLLKYSSFLLFILLISTTSVHAKPIQDTINVGYYEFLPFSSTSPSHKAEGMFIDIINEIAKINNIKIKYHKYKFEDGLNAVSNNKVDLFLGVAYSEERGNLFSFSNNSLIDTWGVVITNHGTHLSSILDLENKKIATIKSDMLLQDFLKITNSFNINTDIIYVDTYEDVIKLVSNHEVDGGILEKFMCNSYITKYDYEISDIIFSPTGINIVSNNTELLNLFDKYLGNAKFAKDSFYTTSINKWVKRTTVSYIPKWLKTLLILIIITSILLSIIVYFMKRTINKKTKELSIYNRKLRHYLNNTAEGFYVIGNDGDLLGVNTTLCNKLGYTEKELLEIKRSDVFHDKDFNHKHIYKLVKEYYKPVSIINTHISKDGSIIPVNLNIVKVNLDGIDQVIVLSEDISEKIEMQNALTYERDFSKIIIDNTKGIIITTNIKNEIVTINNYGLNVLESTIKQVERKLWYDVFYNPEKHDYIKNRFENTNIKDKYKLYQKNARSSFYNKSGKLYIFDWKRSIIREPLGEPLVISVGIDVTSSERRKNQIEKLAFYDSLTDLPNRQSFNKYINNLINDSATGFAIMLLDLDNFKRANDIYGHDFGDLLLIEVTKRILNIASKHFVSRFGGDEFIIIYNNYQDKSNIEKLCQNIIDTISKNFVINSCSIFISCSIGISLFPQHSLVKDDLFKFADMAMYNSKKLGKKRFGYYDNNIFCSMTVKNNIHNNLRYAIEKQELSMFYQPIYDATSMNVRCFEALIRWHYNHEHYISPDVFIPVAEETSYIVELGKWIIEEVCKDLSIFKAKGFSMRCVSINVSAIQIGEKNFINDVLNIINKYSISSKEIIFEITENVLIKNNNHYIKKLSKLRELGYKISLDDFGTGYSSLNYLSFMPIDILKIDKQFVEKSLSEKSYEKLLDIAIHISEKFGLNIIAEGVETKEQLAMLLSKNCNLIQGYYFSKPMNFNDTLNYLKNSQNSL